jgi:hypothetical protein
MAMQGKICLITGGTKGITGKYFVDCKMTQPAPQATDRAVAKKLWDVSAEMVHLAEGEFASV